MIFITFDEILVPIKYNNIQIRAFPFLRPTFKNDLILVNKI